MYNTDVKDKQKMTKSEQKKLLRNTFSYIDEDNIVDKFDADTLKTVSNELYECYKNDLASCKDWLDTYEKSMKIAKKIYGAANVKYPLTTNAVIQFSSRATAETIKDGRVVQVAIPDQETVDNITPANTGELPDINQLPVDPNMPPEMQQQAKMQMMKQIQQENAAKAKAKKDQRSVLDQQADILSKHLSFQLLVE
jgi:hypothetical protein